MEKVIRVTKSQRISDIISLLSGDPVSYDTTVNEAIAFLNHERELLDKKNTRTGTKKLTPTQVENESLKGLILDYLSSIDSEDGVTCSDILKAIPEFSEFQVQKVSGLVRQLLPATEKNPKGTGQVISQKIGGKTLFKLA